MQRLMLFIIAILFLIAGVLTLPTPIPLGAILLAIGLGLLVMTSVTVRNWLRRLRERFPEVDGSLRAVDAYLPRNLRRALRLSAPRRPKKDDGQTVS